MSELELPAIGIRRDGQIDRRTKQGRRIKAEEKRLAVEAFARDSLIKGLLAELDRAVTALDQVNAAAIAHYHVLALRQEGQGIDSGDTRRKLTIAMRAFSGTMTLADAHRAEAKGVNAS